MIYACAFIYADGTRCDFVIHDPAPEWCSLSGGIVDEGRGRTPGSALANTVELTHPKRRIAEVHAPRAVLDAALTHARRRPQAFMGYGLPPEVNNYFPLLRTVPTDV